MKLNVKVNTMQNTNILLFVRSLSLMYGQISDRSLLTLQLTSEESVSRHVSVQMVDITVCEQTLADNSHFSRVFGSTGFYPPCQLFTVLMLDGR